MAHDTIFFSTTGWKHIARMPQQNADGASKQAAEHFTSWKWPRWTCVQRSIAENSRNHTVKRHTTDSLELMPRAR